MWDIILDIIMVIVCIVGWKMFSDSRSYKDWPKETWPEHIKRR